MEFEFDEAKSKTNAVKHGMDFIAAQELWLDELLIEIPARTVDEPRSLVIGLIGNKHYGGHHAPRGPHPDHLGEALPGRGGGDL